MSQFIVFRSQKHKSAIGLRHSLRHAMREQPTPNADPAKLKDNYYIQLDDGRMLGENTVDKAMERYQSKLPDKVRKNAVHCVEFVVSGSPEHLAKMNRMEQINFFEDATNYIAKKMGGLDNVIHAQVHFDELTPHLTLFVVPIDEKGKLNARKFIGGNKNVMRDMQTEIAEKVGKKYGFERGIAKDKPDNHIEIKKFYQVLDRFDKFLNDRNFVPSDEFMDKLSKDVLLLLKKDETLERIESITTEMRNIQNKWDTWARNKGFTATIASRANNRMYFKSVTDHRPEHAEFEENALRYRSLMDTLNNELFPTEKIIRETEEEILQNVKLSGVGAFFGVAKPEDFIPSIIQFFHQKLNNEVSKRKKSKEDESKEENDRLENEKRALSDRRIALENQYQIANKEEINKIRHNFEVQKENLLHNFEVQKEILLSKIEQMECKLNDEIDKNKVLKNELFMNNAEYFKGEIKKLSDENNLLKSDNLELKTELDELKKNMKDPQYIKDLHEKNEMAKQQNYLPKMPKMRM